MLDHVDRQQVLIVVSESRVDSYPHQKRSKQKATGTPWIDCVRGSRSKAKPST
jgi:hypothetical protein